MFTRVAARSLRRSGDLLRRDIGYWVMRAYALLFPVFPVLRFFIICIN